jgi:ElaB/YqjD/DUF883 family membrane-anchored ribosome-binding protein
MGKGREKQVRQKLAKAQKRLLDLEEVLAVVQTEGEERVRIARERADKRVAKARKRVDRQAHVVAEREAQLYALVGPRTVEGDVTSPTAAADVLEKAIVEEASDNGATAHVSPEGPEVPLIVPADSDIRRNEYEGDDAQS